MERRINASAAPAGSGQGGKEPRLPQDKVQRSDEIREQSEGWLALAVAQRSTRERVRAEFSSSLAKPISRGKTNVVPVTGVRLGPVPTFYPRQCHERTTTANPGHQS
jgi:hypothetical protein